MDEQEPACECDQPGWCKRYQISQEFYPWSVCQRGDYTSNRYKKKWRLALAEASQDGPSLAQRAANYAAAMARASLVGFKRVSLEVLETRQQLCDTCEFNNKERGICNHPGCGCPVKRDLRGGFGRPSKLELASERCPLAKWLQQE